MNRKSAKPNIKRFVIIGTLGAAYFFYCSYPAFAGGAAMMEKRAGQQMQHVQTQKQAVRHQNAQVKQVAGLDEVIAALNHSAENWRLIIDPEAKAAVAAYYIGQFARQGAKIQLPPMYYVQMIDGMSQSDPQMLRNPFPRVLQIVAILEYDFDNGQNKDELALKILGNREAVEKNRQRLIQMRQSK